MQQTTEDITIDWSQAPFESRYYTLDGQGACWWAIRPQPNYVSQCWEYPPERDEDDAPLRSVAFVADAPGVLPPGVDWTAAIWPRPQPVARPQAQPFLSMITNLVLSELP